MVEQDAKQTTDLELLIQKTKEAQKQFANFTQYQVDKIFYEAALAASKERIPLAKLAVEETGMGIFEDKVIKNHFASEYIYNKYANLKTCGVLEEDLANGFKKIAEPRGVIAGIVPTTNPTSTTIFKALLALKTRNGIIFSPHPRAKRCTTEAAKIVLDAAVKAGAPENIISWIEEPTVELSSKLMSHKDISLILATGGPGMVKAAYSSGNPAIGVGPGNTPVILTKDCRTKMAVSSILLSKTFDNGMICASEQAVLVDSELYEKVKKEFILQGSVFIEDKEEIESLKNVLQTPEGKLNPKIVGQSAHKIANMAGILTEENTKVLIVPAEKIGQDEPLSKEKLSPVLAIYKFSSFEDGVEKAKKLLENGGLGHTAVIYTEDEKQVSIFQNEMSACRVLVNSPASQGGIGDLYNFSLTPSLTLGCGSWGGNYISENVGPFHLLNIKSVAERRENMLWFQVPPKIYFKPGCLLEALEDLKNRKKVFLVTDHFISTSGMIDQAKQKLESMGMEVFVFDEVLPDPTIQMIGKGMEKIKIFQPDVIMAVGGGSPIDAAKVMWLMYENPEVKFEDVASRFMDIRKRVVKLKPLGEKALLVAVPTTSGTGSEVTPFAVITDEETSQKFPLADYSLTPSMAIIDSQLVKSLPKGLTAISGLDALTHALEARVSCMQSDYTNALAMEATKIIFKHLPACYADGENEPCSRERMFNASTMAGMAFSNAFLGLCHSMAHKLGGMYHIPHGLANAFLIEHIIRYNSQDCSTKQAAFPQYLFPHAKHDYAEVARYIGLEGDTEDELVEALIEKIQKLKADLGIPKTMKEWLDSKHIFKQTFLVNLDRLSEMAFDDQCTGANPRYPLVEEIKEIYLKAYFGEMDASDSE